MQDVANRVNEQRRLAAQGQTDPQPWSGPQAHVQTDFVIEEQPDDAVATQSQRQPHRPRHGQKPQRALPPAASGFPVESSTANQGLLAAAPTPGSTMPARPIGQVAPPSSSRRPQHALLEAAAPSSSEFSSGPQNSTAPAPNRSRHAAIEAAPTSSMGSLSSSQRAATSRAPYAALEAPPSRTSDNVIRQPQMPNAATKSPPTRQLAGLEAPPVAQTGPQGPIHQQQNVQAAHSRRQVQGAASQRQLEAPPAPAQPVHQQLQIGGASSQRQLEAPPSSSGSNTVTGRSLFGRVGMLRGALRVNSNDRQTGSGSGSGVRIATTRGL